jgi:hypothetical protein
VIGSRQDGDWANQSVRPGVRNRIVFDYFTLDGVVNNDPNFSAYIVLPSIDALQEFKMQSGVYPANEATQINVLTKSGGNAFHGSLFEFVRDTTLTLPPSRLSPSISSSRRSNGTITASRLGAPSSFRSRSTADTSSSLWSTTNARRAAEFPKRLPCAHRGMFGGDFSALGTAYTIPSGTRNLPGTSFHPVPSTRFRRLY